MSEIRDKIVRILSDVSPISSFDPDRDGDRDLLDLGLDSLDQMSLFIAVQEEFGIGEIPEDDIDGLTSIDLITTYVDQRLSSKT